MSTIKASVFLFLVFTMVFWNCKEAKAAAPFNKVMVVILENTNADTALNEPYLASLARHGAVLVNFHGVAHPSQPNYIALVAGKTWGILFDHPVNLPFTNIVDLLEQKGESWKVYAESYPGHCFTGDNYGTYYRKHNPLISFDDIHNNPERCSHIVNANAMAGDWLANRLPDYSFYVPDINDDGHNTSPAYSDQWLQKTFAPLLNDVATTQSLLLAVTFDESETYLNNHIITVLAGPGVIPGSASLRSYNHYNLLRTIEAGLGLGTLGREDAEASVIQDIWQQIP